MIDTLTRWAEDRGYAVALGPSAVLSEAAGDIEARYRDGDLDPDFYQNELSALVEATRKPPAGTVVMVAVPRAAHRVRFELDDGPLDAVLPPTYVNYRPLFEDVRQDLAQNGLPGARVEHLAGPLKATAARLGLVRYGRNNVTYAPGLGSYIQLCAFLTDAGLPGGEAHEARQPALLDECEQCGACAAACPTGAIDADRVLISAHRCLTFANENEGDWPGWVHPKAHTCLLGCLECQQVCPANPPLTIRDTGVAFSSSECRALLREGDADGKRFENGIRFKLAWLGQPYAEPVLGRNLRALLSSRGKVDRAS